MDGVYQVYMEEMEKCDDDCDCCDHDCDHHHKDDKKD